MELSPWYEHHIKVRYSETDQMKVVYHTNYVNWFEIGRTELIRSLGMSYRTIEETGLLLPLIDLQMQFKHPAKYDDCITIRTQIADYSPIRLQFNSEICREDKTLVSGTTRHVWLNLNWKPARIDKAAPELYKLIQKHNSNFTPG
jgi:acyl-CoA thioester hydrolase